MSSRVKDIRRTCGYRGLRSHVLSQGRTRALDKHYDGWTSDQDVEVRWGDNEAVLTTVAERLGCTSAEAIHP
jgi:hypothetical protein